MLKANCKFKVNNKIKIWAFVKRTFKIPSVSLKFLYNNEPTIFITVLPHHFWYYKHEINVGITLNHQRILVFQIWWCQSSLIEPKRLHNLYLQAQHQREQSLQNRRQAFFLGEVEKDFWFVVYSLLWTPMEKSIVMVKKFKLTFTSSKIFFKYLFLFNLRINLCVTSI